MGDRTSLAVPARGALAREQLRVVGLAVRREALFAALLLLATTVLLAIVHLRSLSDPEYHPELAFLPILGLPLAALGLLAPLAVWKGDDLSSRGYLWSLPADRRWSQLSKSAAGWLWLMGAVALYMGWAWAMAELSGGDVGVATTRVWMGEGRIGSDPSGWRLFHSPTPGWQWAVPFTAATTAYLFGSILVIGTSHPWRWAAAVWAGWLFLSALAESLGAEPLQQLVSAVMQAPYGAEMVLTGQGTVFEPVATPSGDTRTWIHEQPDLRDWLVATLIWMGLGTAGTLLAATRHRGP